MSPMYRKCRTSGCDPDHANRKLCWVGGLCRSGKRQRTEVCQAVPEPRVTPREESKELSIPHERHVPVVTLRTRLFSLTGSRWLGKITNIRACPGKHHPQL